MKTNKGLKITYWITTGLFFLLDGLLPVFTSHMPMAVESIRHLGYPDYFRVLLTVYKGLGGFALILPVVKNPFKEWAYAGFGFTLISAFVSHAAVDGLNGDAFAPIIGMAILVTSYITYHRLKVKGSQSA